MITIPIIDKSKETWRQHFVPQTYMKKWSPNKTSVYSHDKLDGVTRNRKIEKINYISYYYDFLPGGYMPDEVLESIYGFLSECRIEYTESRTSPQDGTVTYEVKVATTFEEFNNAYEYRDSWKIIESDGTVLNDDILNAVREYLSQARNQCIEHEWDRQYENNWTSFIDGIESKVRTYSSDGAPNITDIDFHALFRYMFMYNWRDASSNENVADIVSWIIGLFPEMEKNIPEGNRIHAEDTTINDELIHDFMRRTVYKSLKNDSDNSMDKMIEAYYANTSFIFCLTDSAHPFITSNHPSFKMTNKNGYTENVFIATPTMLLTTARPEIKGQYMVCNITPDEVLEYNKAIADKGSLLIFPNDSFDVGSVMDT